MKFKTWLKNSIPIIIMVLVAILIVIAVIITIQEDEKFEKAMHEQSRVTNTFTVTYSDHSGGKVKHANIQYSNGNYTNYISGLPREYEQMYPVGTSIEIMEITYWNTLTEKTYLRLYIKDLRNGQFYHYNGAGGMSAIIEGCGE